MRWFTPRRARIESRLGLAPGTIGLAERLTDLIDQKAESVWKVEEELLAVDIWVTAFGELKLRWHHEKPG